MEGKENGKKKSTVTCHRAEFKLVEQRSTIYEEIVYGFRNEAALNLKSTPI